jgi:hypothetical protein
VRFFLDANMPRSAISALTGLGHEVEFSRDIGMANERDEVIAARARETQAVLVNRDLDFADVRRYPHGRLLTFDAGMRYTPPHYAVKGEFFAVARYLIAGRLHPSARSEIRSLFERRVMDPRTEVGKPRFSGRPRP